MTNISVLGSGAFGTALAITLAREGNAISLWSRNAADAQIMQETRQNSKRLLGHVLPKTVAVSAEIDTCCANDTLLIVVPMQQLRHFLAEYQSLLNGKILVACCKGVDLVTGLGPVALINAACPDATAAILTGPSFAADIAKGLPTALTLACADESVGKSLQKSLSTANLRLYRTADTIGAELGGALKNVIAIACGIVMGADLGESARAALMTRGYAEMQRLAHALGADENTLAGLSGFGDLTLTCTSARSRNTAFGVSLGRGQTFDPSVTVEGAATAKAVTVLAKNRGIDMPITTCVAAILDQTLSIPQAIEALLSRPLKKE
jgi:glycerol-3-phosphate dehydrogenase (NAD(P)+)